MQFSKTHLIKDGKLFGLNSEIHSDAGFPLVEVPASVFSSLVSVGLLKKAIKVMKYSDRWCISFNLGDFEVKNRDFEKLIESGLSGVRVDKDMTLVYFNINGGSQS